MKLNTPLFIGLAGLLVYRLVGLKQLEKRLTISPVNLEFIKSRPYLVLDFINPTNTSVKVENVVLNVIIDSVQVGSVEKFSSFDILANNRTQIKLPIAISPTALLLITKLFSLGKQLKIAIIGSYKLSNLPSLDYQSETLITIKK